jgi:hypothetical protein
MAGSKKIFFFQGGNIYELSAVLTPRFGNGKGVALPRKFFALSAACRGLCAGCWLVYLLSVLALLVCAWVCLCAFRIGIVLNSDRVSLVVGIERKATKEALLGSVSAFCVAHIHICICVCVCVGLGGIAETVR